MRRSAYKPTVEPTDRTGNDGESGKVCELSRLCWRSLTTGLSFAVIINYYLLALLGLSISIDILVFPGLLHGKLQLGGTETDSDSSAAY